LDILSFKKEAKLSATDVPGVDVGNGEEDLRFSSFFNSLPERLEFSEDVETKINNVSWWQERVCDTGCTET